MVKKSVRVGISLRVVDAPNYNEKRDALSQDWIFFLEKLGVIPVFIPNNMSDVKDFLKEMNIDGLILSGGDNIGDHPERDKTERNVIEFAIESKTPLLGICRGMQVINKFFDGNVVKNKNSKHVGNVHQIKILNLISKLFDGEKILVNSFHNNIIPKDMLGSELNSFAISTEDNTVEGFFHKKLPFSGIMWHPERDQNENNLLIVKQLLKLQSNKS
ncbi:peptidase C26 [Candidatus Nitrosopumilus sp. SW]|uniref:gamma-glutamyl-gamma-aminobutyrate hydrolase family protein n=1 Tax=Candidatus Nitrosopumilus sp. SW TaxID=2508726 RepID=UPI0011542AF9|nr:gamma-glutamyl-gamma-aminobutyrate hydrolase family protein [Candidatus Nitrosopumilus sp. SW]QDI88796.1 peptidase C26 [Candidatus Nitrosopumilus sp. SW]